MENKNLTLILTTFFIIISSVLALILFNRFVLNGKSVVSNKIVLDYWGLYESELVMDEMIKKYENENPNIQIRYVQKLPGRDLNDYKKSLLVRLQNKTGPAIFRAHSTWMPGFYSELSKTNKALDVKTFNDRFYPSSDNQCVTLSGQIVCIPIMYDGLALLYNVDMLRNDGINPESIQSWDDLRTAAIRLTRYENNESNIYNRKILRAGVALGDASNVVNTTDILGLMFFQNDISIPDDLDNEKASLIFEFYTDFSTKDQVWDKTMPSSLDAFASGRVAMAFARSDQILDILKLNPTMNIGALSVPQLPIYGGGLTNKGWASFWVETVSDDLNATEQKEAWKFLEWLSKEENQIARFNISSKYKKFGEPYSAKNLRNNLINSPLIGPILRTAPNSKTGRYTDWSGNDSYINLFENALTKYLEYKGRDNSDIFTDLKKDYDELIKKSLKYKPFLRYNVLYHG